VDRTIVEAALKAVCKSGIGSFDNHAGIERTPERETNIRLARAWAYFV
jgi:hypothetical protein